MAYSQYYYWVSGAGFGILRVSPTAKSAINFSHIKIPNMKKTVDQLKLRTDPGQKSFDLKLLEDNISKLQYRRRE